MSQVFETLQDRYRDLMAEGPGGLRDEAYLERVRVLLQEMREAGAVVGDPDERSLLRAYMRFLAALLLRAGQELPEMDLMPLDRERRPVRFPADRPRVPAWVWGLVGAAAIVVVAGLIGMAGLSFGAFSPGPAPTLPPTPSSPPPTSTPAPTPTPTPTPSPTPTPRPSTPAFSPITIALGMLSPTEPFLVGDEFDWNTRAVYAVFDYTGMRDELAWSVVWVRNGEEIARESHFWDLERDGVSGTLWVAYFNPDGTVLRGGDYTVSLYIENRLAAEASFRIRYYVPPTPQS